MRIQHNIPAMNSYRNYTNNVSKVAKNLEKLSTGYKINRAGDDAAGLAISEKMRAQITGLATAQKNAKDGISLVQTAEGALTEVHDMLNRMVDLAEQSANGTYDNTTDRYQLQKEVNQLRDEINRIADSSNFNGINLLDGSMDTSVRNASNVKVTVVADGQLGQDPQAGVYAIDFTNTSLEAKTAGATVGLNVWGVDLTLNVGTKNGDALSGQSLAEEVAKQWNAANTDKWDTSHGFLMNATVDGNKVVFTMDKAPSKEFTETAATGQFTYNHTEVNGNNAEQVTVTQLREAVDTTKGRLYGQAKFDLNSVGVSDGKTITIGDETYTFAVGAGSRFAGMSNVIDLTDMTANDKTALVAAAARRLSTAAQGNTRFKVGTNNNNGEIVITEKEGGVDYTVNNLAGKDGKGSWGIIGDTKDAKATDWAGLVKTGSADPTKGLTLQIGDTAATYNQLRVSIGDCHTSALGISEINISTQDGGAAAMTKIKAAINYVSDVRGTLGATQNRLDHTINNLSVMQQNIQDAESTIRDVDVAEEMMSYTKNNILVQSAQAMLAQANQLPQGVLQLLG